MVLVARAIIIRPNNVYTVILVNSYLASLEINNPITANYNRDALNAYRVGDLDNALYWSNLSLRNTTEQPEMIRLRERITNEKESVWERDLIRELLQRETQAEQVSAEVLQ